MYGLSRSTVPLSLLNQNESIPIYLGVNSIWWIRRLHKKLCGGIQSNFAFLFTTTDELLSPDFLEFKTSVVRFF